MLAFLFLIFLVTPINGVVCEMNKRVFQVLIFLRVALGCKPHKTIFVEVQPARRKGKTKSSLNWWTKVFLWKICRGNGLNAIFLKDGGEKVQLRPGMICLKLVLIRFGLFCLFVFVCFVACFYLFLFVCLFCLFCCTSLRLSSLIGSTLVRSA